MTNISIVSRFNPSRTRFGSIFGTNRRGKRLNWHDLAQNPETLPGYVRQSPVAMRYLHLFDPLAWEHFPERDLHRNWGKQAVPYAAFAAACLVKLDLGFTSMAQLRAYMLEHPALVSVLGFPLKRSSQYPWGFDVKASLPTHRHFTRLLRTIPNQTLQFLLDSTVVCLQTELATIVGDFGQTISIDTKHILAWVAVGMPLAKENNPKAYVKDRYNKKKQPKGDPDCRLGCKRRRNQRASSKEPPPTPRDNPVPADTISIGEFYWGYGSGIAATKVSGWGEFVLAEWTQPFDRPDVSYFFPLMQDVEHRLGFRPRFGGFDAAFDAWYVYEYFHRDDEKGGFAAVPFSKRGGYQRSFDPEGLPLCQAGLSMPLKYRFKSKSGLFEHERGRYVCPLFFPEEMERACPVEHQRWSKGGCTTTMPTSIGARIRYQLDRESQAYKDIYQQRTATERINAQAKEIGIERPKIRNGQAIANQNTLIYVLINLRAIQRIRQRKADLL